MFTYERNVTIPSIKLGIQIITTANVTYQDFIKNQTKLLFLYTIQSEKLNYEKIE